MKKRLLFTILSISLLTVMAGAAIAPALGVISAHFEGRNPLLIQLIVSLPALFIILTNLVFPWLCRLMKRFAAQMKYVAPLGFAAGYLCLATESGFVWLLLGSAFIGIANGIGVPYLNTIGSVKAGKEAATTVMPLLSAALYLGQFLSPLIVSPVASATGTSPYFVGVGIAALYLLQAILTRKKQMLPK